jgi:dihydroneopterin aldolase
MGRFSIHLNNCIFFAYHGLFEEERLVGNHFEVSVVAELEETGPITRMSESVNYAEMYAIVQTAMQHPTPLLETLAQKISADIHASDHRIQQIEINIKKLNPAISNFTGTVGISYKKNFLL